MASFLHKILLVKHPPASQIYIHSTSDSFFLFAFVERTIHISKLSNFNNTNIPDKEEFNGETLNVDNPVVRIFCHDEKFFGVDKTGTLFSICLESGSDANAEYDLFEDSPEGEKWSIGSRVSLVTDRIVYGCALLDDGQLALLTASESSVFLELVRISYGTVVNSFLIRSPGISNQQPVTTCLVEWIPAEKVDNDFVLSWFKEGREKSSFFLITLPDGMIIALFPDSSDTEYLYVSPSSYISLNWHYSSIADSGVGKCSLSVVAQSGAVVRLSEVGQLETSYFPVSILRTAFIDGSLYLYVSDWNHSYRLALATTSQPCISLPLKGILCWGGWGNRYTVGLSRNGELYCLDNEYEMKEIREMLPNSSHTANLIRKTEALEEINSTISKMDEYMKAVALVNKNLVFSVSAQPAYVRGQEYRICLRIKLATEGVRVNKRDWLLGVTMSADSSQSIRTCYKLEDNLQYPSILIQQVNCHLPKHPSAQLTLRLQLVYIHLTPLVNYLPFIHVGTVYMDPSYFILPSSEIDSSYEWEPDLDALLKGDSCGTKLDCEKEDTKLRIELSEDYPPDTVFKNLLMNCRPLWRTSAWLNACGETELDLAIANKLVKVKLKEGSVNISGNDARSCYMMKHALFFTSPKGCHFVINPAEAVNQLEMYQRSCELLLHMDKPPVEKIQELRLLLRNNITSKLTL